MSQFKDRESKFSLTPPFCSSQAFGGLDEARSHWGGQSALLSPDSNVNLIQKHLHRHTQNNV